MSDQIVRLVQPEERPRGEVVDALRDALARAEAGDVRACAVVMVDASGGLTYSSRFGDAAGALCYIVAGMRALEFDMLQAATAQGEP